MTQVEHDNEETAFLFDEDEDMNALIAAAEKAGDASTEDNNIQNFDLDDLGSEDISVEDLIRSSESAKVEEAPVVDSVEFDDEIDFDIEDTETVEEDTSSSTGNQDLDKLLNGEDPFAEDTIDEIVEEIIEESVLEVEPEPEPEVKPVERVKPVVSSPEVPTIKKDQSQSPMKESPKVPTAQTPVQTKVSIPTMTEDEKIAEAKAIITAVDIYRDLPSTTKHVIAQLISQDPEASTDEEIVIVKAMKVDSLTFNTMASLKKAKELTPVDRAFYILGLQENVREALGGLTRAFAGDIELVGSIESLDYAKSLVTAIDTLTDDAISFVSAAESVVRAVKNR